MKKKLIRRNTKPQYLKGFEDGVNWMINKIRENKRIKEKIRK